MSASAFLQARVDGEQKAKADAVLGRLGLTIDDAVKLLVNRIAEDGALPAGLATDPSGHAEWIATEVRRALADERTPVSDADTKSRFPRRRDVALLRLRPDEA